MSNKILITGGLGFIGSHFITSLDYQIKSIVIVDDLSNADIKILYKLRKLTKFEIIFFKRNLNDQCFVEFLFKTFRFSHVVHFAGLKAVGDSVKYPGKYYYRNVIGSKVLIDLIKKYNVRNLIFSSSATVYGKPIKLPLDENHPNRATNPYGQNKIDIENILLNDSYFHNGCSVKILRYFNPIGAHPSGLIGENPKGVPNNLMPHILKVARREYQIVKVFGDDYNTPDGTGIRDYIHIMDLVDGHIKALNYQKKGVSVFNLGTGRGYSVLDLIKTFEEINDITVPFEIIARRAGDVEAVYANPSKAKSVLGFEAKYSLEDMCRDAWKFTQINY